MSRAPLLILLFLVIACESEQDANREYKAPVVVFAAGDDDGSAQLFAEFTRETGIPVTIRSGDSATLTAEVIANRGPQRADVLLTDNVADIWHAADEGALRPISGDNMAAIAPYLKDPDALWAAIGFRTAVIAIGRGGDAAGPGSYADLAKPAYSGQLCLASSSLALNRSVVAMLFAELGKRPAENIVRGWVRNLALPVFDSEQSLMDGMESGSCGYAIVSSHLVGQSEAVLPQPAYVDIEGVGVARHAGNPESAHRLVDWLLSASVQSQRAAATGTFGVRSDLIPEDVAKQVGRWNIGRAGWHASDASLLVERAGYR